MQTPALELSILVNECTLKTDHYSDTSTFWKLRFVTINEKGEVRNPSRTSFDCQYQEFDDLIFRVWISWSTGEVAAGSWEMLYDQLYATDRRDCERMLKCFKRLDKIREKIPINPSTFGDYVALMCSGLGIKRFVQTVGKGGSWHTENTYRFSEIKWLAERVNRNIRDAAEAKFPKSSEVA